MEKKIKKYYYTIGEVSNLLQLKPYILRYWEKEFQQLKPHKKLGGNRRYNPEDIALLKRIKYMLYIQKYTIEGVRKKLKEMKDMGNQFEFDFDSEKNERKRKVLSQLKEIRQLLAGDK